MKSSIFSSIRKSHAVHIFFACILSNLVMFGQPLDSALRSYLNERKSRDFNSIGGAGDRNLSAAAESATIKEPLWENPSAMAETHTTFFALEQQGSIGAISEEDREDVSDNIFSISLPQDITNGKYDAVLAYDLYGLSSASGVTKSINNNPSYGGKVISLDNKWVAVREYISVRQLKPGLNEVFFNRRDNKNYEYKVRNVRIELKEKGKMPFQITQNLTNNRGSLYFSAIVSDPQIQEVEILGRSIPVHDNVIEEAFTGVPSHVKHIEVSYKIPGNSVQSVNVPVQYVTDEISYIFTDGTEEAGIYAAEDLTSRCAVHQAVSVALEGAYTGMAQGKVEIKGLSFKDVKGVDANLVNVTAGDHTAYRMKKINIPDSIPVRISIKYDPSKIPDGYTPKDIRTFYFDRGQRSWKAVTADSLDFGNNEVIAYLYNNETDFINGVIKMPESPETGSFAPTTITDMQYADPATGVVSVAPPSANSTGAAVTGFPLKLPQGRNGMQPSLEVSYNSEAGNNWMGVGWNLSTPAITLNTKWGAPLFDSTNESEIYSLNGSDLVYKDAATGLYGAPHRMAQTRSTGTVGAVKTFYVRKEGGYQKIVRRGTSPSTYWWEVTDKQGNKSFYGSYNGSSYPGVIRADNGAIAHWSLVRTQDPYGNYADYTYSLTSTSFPGTAIPVKEYYPVKIEYTMKSGITNYYRVEFKRNSYSVGTTGTLNARADVISNARNGYMQYIDDLLTEVHVSMVQGSTVTRIRTYRFDYSTVFYKNQLSRISEYDAANALFYSNTFEYFNEVSATMVNQSMTWTGNATNDVVTSPLQAVPGFNVSPFPNGSPLGTSVSGGFSAALRAGVGLAKDPLFVNNVNNTIGFSFDYSQNTMDGKISLVDINGDGLPDKVYKGLLSGPQYRLNTGNGFGGLISANGLSMGKTKSRTTGFGVDANAFGALGIGKSWSKTRSETDNYFVDMNGDGLPDLVSGNRVYFNTTYGGDTNNRDFIQSVSSTENPIVAGAVDNSLVQYLRLPSMNELREEHPQFDHVKVWKAPYTGTINISGNAIRTFQSGMTNPNNFRVTIEHPATPANNLSKTLGNGSTTSMTKTGMSVNKGDLIFFRVHNNDYGYGGEVEWNPVITYQTMPSITGTSIATVDENGKVFNSFNALSDYSINNGGGVGLYSGDTAVTLYFNLSPFSPATLFSDDITFTIKHVRLNTTTGVETSYATVQKVYNHASNNFTSPTSYNAVLSTTSTVKDIFYFTAESTSNVNWGALNWKPTYVGNISGTHYPAVTYKTYDENVNQGKYWFTGTELPDPNITDPSQYNQSFLRIYHNMKDQNYTNLLNGLEDYEFPLKINWVVKKKISNVTSTLHKRTFYIYKLSNGSYVFTKTANPNDVLNFNTYTDYYQKVLTKLEIKNIKDGAGLIYSAFYIEDRNFAVNNTAAIVLESVTSPQPSGYPKGLPQPFMASSANFMGYSYRGWGQFLYNGGIRLQRDSEYEVTLPETIVANYGSNINNASLNSPIDVSLFNYENGQGVQDVDPGMSPENLPAAETSLRYTFYSQDNQNLKYTNDAIKTAVYGFNANGKLTAKVGRFAEPDLYAVYVDPATLTSGGTGVFIGLKQRSESKGSAVSGNLGWGSGTESKADSKTLNQYIDLNGDRYPDLVTGKVQYTDMQGALTTKTLDLNGFYTGDSSEDHTIGINVPGIAPKSTESDNTSDDETKTNVSAGINTSNGTSFDMREWADMNGDGLTDQVRIVPNSDTSKKIEVSLNTGYAFTPFIAWGTTSVLTSNTRSNLGLGVGLSYSSSLAIGFGASKSTANPDMNLIDVNGDGLPDLVTRSGTGSAYIYYLNNGKGFEATSGTFFSGSIGTGSKMEQDTSVSGNAFGSFTYGIPIPIPFLGITIKITGSPSVGINGGISQKESTVQDINGDGFPDVIGNAGSSNNNSMVVRLNTTGKTHLLKKVNLPLGGTWTVDYTASSKDYNMPNHKWLLSRVETFDGFITDSGLRPDGTLSTMSYENGKYDRREREFLGFEKVRVEQRDAIAQSNPIYRYTVATYHNENYYLSGIQKHSALYTQAGQLLSEESTLFNILNPDNPLVNFAADQSNNYLQSGLSPAVNYLDKSRLFVVPVRTVSTSYEGSDSLSAVKEYLKYSNTGNLLEYIDYGTGAEDAFKSVMEYYTSVGPLENSTGFPKKITVYKNSGSQPMRQRESSYNSLGKLYQLTTKLNTAGETNRMEYAYDSYGNVTSVKALDNVNGSGPAYEQTISYDTTVYSYPVGFSNSFGENSSVSYNYLFGIALQTTDMNNKSMRVRIDNRGRVFEVTGPNEFTLGTNAWTIRTQYKNEGATNWTVAANGMRTALGSFAAINPGTTQTTANSHYAITRHFDPEYATGATTTNEFITITIVDGLGKPIQVKKTHVSNSLKWMVTGFEKQDAYGRTIAAHLPVVQNTYPTNLADLSGSWSYLNVSAGSLSDPVVMTYDERDRTLTVKQPGESTVAATTYAIADGMFVQNNTNELGQTAVVHTDIRGRERKVIQNSEIETLFDYNAINELVKVTDNNGFITAYLYDMAGRQTEMQHPDRGVVTFKYNKIGNITEKSTSKMLLSGGQKVLYTYDFGRLIGVTYPEYPQKNVFYRYGQPLDNLSTDNNAVGRILSMEDESGVQVFAYGNMGEVTKNLRSVAVAGYQSFWFYTAWKYDSWNRIQEITYPDREVVSYGYNKAGMLEKVTSTIPGISIPQTNIVESITYNDYGERTQMKYGNGTVTTYDYDVRRRMNKLSHTFSGMQINNKYTYDALSNITGIAADQPQSSLPGTNAIGGPVKHNYEYDDFNRLVNAYGDYTGPGDTTTPYLQQNYILKMEYNDDHTIKRKEQTQYQGTVTAYGGTVSNTMPVQKTSYILDYSDYGTGAFVAGTNYGYQQPHAVRKITERPSNQGTIPVGDPRIKEKEIKYDANGNQTEIVEVLGGESISLRKNLWDEEGRLIAVDLKPSDKTLSHPVAVYAYDANGERVIKYNMDRVDVAANGGEIAQTANDNILLYPSGLIMGKAVHIDTKSNKFIYTKHYYVGPERVGSKTGTTEQLGNYPEKLMQGQMRYLTRPYVQNGSNTAVTDSEALIGLIYQGFGVTPPAMQHLQPNEGTVDDYSHNVSLLNYFYFHSDQVGSSNYITDVNRKVTQHMEYLPFGETLVEEHTNSNNSPFKFNGKEFDEETGNYYYSARYYDPKWSIFVSVDSAAEEYPDMSPYTYCANGPVNYIDPTGNNFYKNIESGEIVWRWSDKEIEGFENLSNKFELEDGRWGDIIDDNITLGDKNTGESHVWKDQLSNVVVNGKSKPKELSKSAVYQSEAKIASKYIGDKKIYQMSDKPGTVDCSRFGLWVAKEAGYTLPRVAYDQAVWYQNHGTWSTKLADAQAGDHIFWKRSGGYHTGVVLEVSNGKIRVIQAQTNGYRPGSIQAHNLLPNGEMKGFNQPFIGVGRYKK
ncbi:toxin TcdB middle/N-terminal domain-containing protein [Flavobacterium sp. ST-75]|uniref:Toxin TcdB middle/N-terminal domain-containing protein n=1 Tax=Flavobacterium rhizophilum TaxID=3163296 RepID=A0ABW8YAB3_9FLAO